MLIEVLTLNPADTLNQMLILQDYFLATETANAENHVRDGRARRRSSQVRSSHQTALQCEPSAILQASPEP